MEKTKMFKDTRHRDDMTAHIKALLTKANSFSFRKLFMYKKHISIYIVRKGESVQRITIYPWKNLFEIDDVYHKYTTVDEIMDRIKPANLMSVFVVSKIPI